MPGEGPQPPLRDGRVARADVQRYLNDEPVQACPPSAWYRFRKFARRNRRAVVTAMAAAGRGGGGRRGGLAVSTALVVAGQPGPERDARP